MDSYQFTALKDMHNNKWTDELLGESFTFVYNRILTKREKIVLDLKIQLFEEGYTDKKANEQIARLTKLKIATILRLLYNIKSKYRHGMDIRVDNKLHPEIYRCKTRKVRKLNESIRKNGQGS